MILRHLHLPGLVSYNHAAQLQQKLVSSLLAHKASPKTIPAPDPTIITTQFHPVYACGRREVGTLSTSQISHLQQPTPWGAAEFVETLRGGQTTFHGPGQLVAYPILDLKRHALSPRCYIHLLESCVMKTCGAYGVATRRTEHPGVWVDDRRKICALGVHLRRNVTSHGIGLNVDTELGWFDRIVGCGLEGKAATSLREQGVGEEVGVDEVAQKFVRFFWEELGVDAAIRVREQDVG
jgi:lipoyl(octanoyl) transferase